MVIKQMFPLKKFIALFAIMLVPLHVLYAQDALPKEEVVEETASEEMETEEGQEEQEEWYEGYEDVVDGIKLRYGVSTTNLSFQTKASGKIIARDRRLEGKGDPQLFPIAVILPESLMNDWSFRSAFFDYSGKVKDEDLAPSPWVPEGEGQNVYFRQSSSVREELINNFFNDDDKKFIEGKDKWALSADTEFEFIYFGYFWGVFLPAFDYHRFFKTGLGVTLSYNNLSVKLNLCEEYKLKGYVSLEESHGTAECVGKKEIDSASYQGFAPEGVFFFNLWERVTEGSVWNVFTLNANINDSKYSALLNKNYKHHSDYLRDGKQAQYIEVLAYTYRF